MCPIPAIAKDFYGQVHPDETPELISTKMVELEMELEKLPESVSKGWIQAQEKCPHLTGNDEKLQFLRCEVFNADLAAMRIAKYWNMRIDLFGPKKAFLPLTLDQALKDDEEALKAGFTRIVPAKDHMGRGLIFSDPSRWQKSNYGRESMARALWYILHALLEDETVQRKGVILLAYPRNARITEFDRHLMKLNSECMQGCIPVRVAAVHVCHPPSFFAMVFPILKLFLTERVKKRIKVHSGSDDYVLGKLAKYELTKEVLPTDLGGDILLDHTGWLKERRCREL